MTDEKQHGAPVRVERENPALVAKVAKAKSLDPDEVKVVSRLEGLLINEDTLWKAAVAASQRLTEARAAYVTAQAEYEAAVAERKEEERHDGRPE